MEVVGLAPEVDREGDDRGCVQLGGSLIQSLGMGIGYATNTPGKGLGGRARCQSTARLADPGLCV